MREEDDDPFQILGVAGRPSGMSPTILSPNFSIRPPLIRVGNQPGAMALTVGGVLPSSSPGRGSSR